VAELDPTRRMLAKRFGATTVIDPAKEDVVSVCKSLCGGQGPHFAFDCAGAAASIKAACSAIRGRGAVVNVAVLPGEVSFDMNTLLFGEKRLLTSLSYTSNDFRSVIDALSKGLMDVANMITSKISIDRVVEDGILALSEGKGVKVLVDLQLG
jgi:threonine dehydrogenase-like Zn-dependent dehydrogenase